MVAIVRFTPEHLTALRLQGLQAAWQPHMTIEHGRELVASKGEAWTALDGDMPIACAGFIEMWANRAYAWSYLSDAALRNFRAVHRATWDVLSRCRWRRVELTTDVHHVAAARWAAHLGFEMEGRLRAWTPDGRDVYQWARVV